MDHPMLTVRKRLDIACGQTYLLELDDGRLLEAGDVFMAREKHYGERPYRFADFDRPADTNKRVMTICTMAGCPMGCRFCASSRTFQRKLTTGEIVGQVEAMRSAGVELGRHPDLNAASEFRVLYTRMGEPMLNAEAVVASVDELVQRHPHVVIGMSTCGIAAGVERFLDRPELMERMDMQFSLHSTRDEERAWLFDAEIGRTVMSIPQIAAYVARWAEKSQRKVSLNWILFDSMTYDFTSFLRHFDPRSIWLRLSPWNVVKKAGPLGLRGLLRTEDVLAKKPMSSDKLAAIIESIEKAGVAYAYAPAIDEEIKYNVACGQALEAFAQEMAAKPRARAAAPAVAAPV